MTNPIPPRFPRDASISRALKTLAPKWGGFVALGLLLLFLGIVASVHVLTAAMVSVWFIGLMMIIGGIAQLIHAWRTRPWASFVLWSLSGLLYLAGGVIAFSNPMLGAMLLTLLLGASLIGLGFLTFWFWFYHRSLNGWVWLVVSGLISVVAGLLIAW